MDLIVSRTTIMRASRAHIAGVGVSGPENAKADPSSLAIVAATKALLDAGITYTDVDQCVVCFDESARISPAWLDIFGATGTAIAQVDNKAGLFVAAQFIKSGQKHCALMIGKDSNVGDQQPTRRISTDSFQRHLQLA